MSGWAHICLGQICFISSAINTTRCICVKHVWNACEAHVKVFTHVKAVWNFKFHTIWCVKNCVKFGTGLYRSWNSCETCVKFFTCVKFSRRFKFHTIDVWKIVWNLGLVCLYLEACVKLVWNVSDMWNLGKDLNFTQVHVWQIVWNFRLVCLYLETCVKLVWNILDVWNLGKDLNFTQLHVWQIVSEISDWFAYILKLVWNREML